MKRHYQVKKQSADDVARMLDQLWGELQQDSGLRKQAKEAGIDVSKISGLKRADAITCESEGAGLDPGTVAVVVALAPVAAKLTPVAAKIISDLWEHVFLPRIKRRWGEDSIVEKKK